MKKVQITESQLKGLVRRMIKEEMEMSQNPENFMSLKIQGNKIMAYEPYFEKDVQVASIYPSQKMIIPSHGYFMPHKYGKMSKKYADSIDYEFNNN